MTMNDDDHADDVDTQDEFREFFFLERPEKPSRRHCRATGIAAAEKKTTVTVPSVIELCLPTCICIRSSVVCGSFV